MTHEHHSQEPLATETHENEPAPELTVLPVIRPAVTVPNPDADAPQIAPTVDVEAYPADPSTPIAESVLTGTSERTAPLPQIPETPAAASPAQRQRRRLPALPSLRRATQPDNSYQVYQEQLPTQALKLRDRLAGSPFEVASKREYQRAAESAEARNTLAFAIKLGETMFRFGAGALEVETSIIVVTQAFGIHETEIDITNQSISLNYAPPGEVPYTLQRVVHSWSQNYAGLAALHRLVSSIASSETNREEAEQRLAELRHKRKPFSLWMSLPATAGFAALFTMFIGGTVAAAGISFINTMIVMTAASLLARLRVPEFFTTMFGGAIATTIALTLYTLHWFSEPSLVVAGSIMMLLPTGRFVSAVQDGINGFPITAAGRLVSALLAFIGLVSGIMIAVVIAEQLGTPTLDLTKVPNVEYPWLVMALIVFFAATLDAIVEQSEWRLLIPSGLVSLVGYLGYLGADYAGVANPLMTGVGAVVIGFLGRIVALKLGSPQLVIAVPSVLFMLPGLTIFRAMYEIAMNEGSVLVGMAGMFSATMIITAIAAGAVLGDTLARPLTITLQANERRRIGRR